MSKFSNVLTTLLAATAATAVVGVGSAGAQTNPAPQPAPAAQDQSAPAAMDRATEASAMTTEPANALVSVTVDANGDRHMLVTSPPVPDTPANRAKYGQPLSRAGRRTAPAGD